MMRKFLDGLVFGAGAALSFILVASVGLYIALPHVIESHERPVEADITEKIDVVDSLPMPDRFLGSTGSHTSDFRFDASVNLADGPGRIVGRAYADGEPLEGLRFRLALNGSAYSAWVETDATGKYEIRLPYGEYIVDGYSLDHSIANSLLPGKISHPGFTILRSNIVVAENREGFGPEFRFVDPVIKKAGESAYSLQDKIVLEWEPYPGAAEYSIQIVERPGDAVNTFGYLFSWKDRPVVEDARVELDNLDVRLTAGSSYNLLVHARDGEGNILSTSDTLFSGYDFEITE